MNLNLFPQRCRSARGLPILAPLIMLLVSACSQPPAAPAQNTPSPASDGAPRRGGTLTMSLAGDVQSWDPLVTTDNATIWTMLLIYDQIVRVAPDGRSVEPALAEKYAVSADGKTYTFTVRQGVTFHDGTPLTVADLQYAIERGTSQESSWKALLPAITSMSTPDDRTLVVELAEPWAAFLADLALYAFSVIPKHQHQQRGAELFDHPVGTGPFRFERWERGSKGLFKRNPTFWDRRYPYLDAVEFQVLSDDNGRMLKFQGGELDIATNVPANQIARLQQDPAVKVQLDPTLGISLIAMNHARPPFDDQYVRLALNLAIDRAAIVNAVLFGHGTVANTVLPPMLYWSAGMPAYSYDVAKARDWLARSSRPQGFDTTLLIGAGSTPERATATIIQAQLKQIGVNLTLVEADQASASERAMSGNYDMFSVSLTSDIIDPNELTAIALAPSGGLNALFTGYKNDELDTLIRQAAGTIDQSKRAGLYEQIQRTYNEDAVVIPLYYPYSRAVVRSYVKGFKVLPTANYRLWEVWLDRASP